MPLLHDNITVDVVSASIAVAVTVVVVIVVEPRLARDAYKIQFYHYYMIHLNCVQMNCLHDMLHFVAKSKRIRVRCIYIYLIVMELCVCSFS